MAARSVPHETLEWGGLLRHEAPVVFLPNSPEELAAFVSSSGPRAALIHSDCREALASMPDDSIDTCITSPPYWSQRRYTNDSGIGQEDTPERYVESLSTVFTALRSKLKARGSLWLNLGDSYDKKQLCGIPWRVALRLQSDGWILRNAVVWDKVKGNPDTAKDKLRNTYELVFHFVKQSDYHYDVDAIRNEPGKATMRDGKLATATGVTGEKYRRQIQRSPELTTTERSNALVALENALKKVAMGELPDFRMVIRGTQRSTHSADKKFSGRAGELEKNGFYILPYHKNGSKPGDIWRITPEDEWRTDSHAAVFPLDLCIIPIRATCPLEGIVFDPFAGTGTAIVSAITEGRRGIGVDTAMGYLKTAAKRIRLVEPTSLNL